MPTRRLLPMCLAALLTQAAAAKAEPVADFYRGKTISLYVGFPPGGGYDLYARVFAPHFSRHIPGNPLIVIKTMLGGSGIQAAGYMTNITPQDGASLGLFLDSLPLGKVLGGHGDFDPVKLTWIRSEEHTSELQSRGHLVCRLLLEKKKETSDSTMHHTNQSSSSSMPRLIANFWPRACAFVTMARAFFFNDTATTEIYTLSLHDALPTCSRG